MQLEKMLHKTKIGECHPFTFSFNDDDEGRCIILAGIKFHNWGAR